MKLNPAFLLVALLVLLCLPGRAASTNSNAPGQQLADELRNSAPTASSEVTGVLNISGGKTKTRIPMRSQVLLEGKTWKTIYLTTTNAPRDFSSEVVIVHSKDKPNEYLHAGPGIPVKTNVSNLLAGSIAFAGSDFTLADLGVEFLHWPAQARLDDERKWHRECYVLESQRSGGSVVRVKCWIDQESKGILAAEGYNVKGDKVKEFTLSGGSFKKVNGLWHLRKMTIRSPANKSETVLQFDLPKD